VKALRTGLRTGIVNNQIVTRIDLGAVRYGQRRTSKARRIVSLIVGLGFLFLLVAVVLAASSRPAHGAAPGQVVCVLGGAQAICPPSLEIGEPPAESIRIYLPIVARNK